ncbi:MAG: hypothetical protein MZU79_00380 [Anaerotruncus sp.]|nr:hypothetical protein [Anaerotruncus sp.]
MDHRSFGKPLGHGHYGLPPDRTPPETHRIPLRRSHSPPLRRGHGRGRRGGHRVWPTLRQGRHQGVDRALRRGALHRPPGLPGRPVAILAGMALWGISVGTQESILKAAIGDRVPEDRRARAFALFNTLFGLAWFAGGAVIGLLYDRFGAVPLVVFSVAVQAAALVVFVGLILGRNRETRRT